MPNPALVFATAPVTTGSGTSSSSLVTPGQATQNGNLLVLAIEAAVGPGAAFPDITINDDPSTGWTLAASVSNTSDPTLNGKLLVVFYKFNCAANEPAINVRFRIAGAPSACKNTVKLQEFNGVRNSSDPLTTSHTALSAASSTNVTLSSSPDSITSGSLILYIVGESSGASAPQGFGLATNYSLVGADQSTQSTAQLTVQARYGTQSTGLQFVNSVLVKPDTWVAALVSFAVSPSLIVPNAANNIGSTGQQATVRFTASGEPDSAVIGMAGSPPTVRPSVPLGTAVAALAGGAPLVSMGSVRTPNVGALTLAGIASTLSLITPVTINPSTATIALTGTASLIAITITPAEGFIILTGLSPPLDTKVATGAGALVLTGTPAVFDKVITPSVGALAFTGIAPSLFFGTVLSIGTGTLSFSGTSSSASFSITPSTGALSLAGVAPGRLTNNRITPVAGSLVVAGIAPVLRTNFNLIPFVGTLNLLPQPARNIGGVIAFTVSGTLVINATVAVTLNEQFIHPNTGGALFAGNAQHVGAILTPSTGSLTTVASSAQSVASNRPAPGTAGLALTATAPTVRIANGCVPGTAVLQLTGLPVGFSFAIRPGTGVLALSGQDRNIPSGITPKVARLTFGLRTPFIGHNIRVYGVLLSDD